MSLFDWLFAAMGLALVLPILAIITFFVYGVLFDPTKAIRQGYATPSWTARLKAAPQRFRQIFL